MSERLPLADRGCDPDRNRARACETGMVPNAGQRKNRVDRDGPRRRRA